MKNLRTFCSFSALFIASSSWATTSTNPLAQMPLSTALSGGGKLVFLQPEQVSGNEGGGTLSYVEQVTYQGAFRKVMSSHLEQDSAKYDPSKPSCLAQFDSVSPATDGLTTDIQPGADIGFTQGTSVAWFTDPLASIIAAMGMADPDLKPLFNFTDANGKTQPALALSFEGAHSPLAKIDCNFAGRTLSSLTIQDFENTTGGRMTFVPSN
jgi:hypothetical protein